MPRADTRRLDLISRHLVNEGRINTASSVGRTSGLSENTLLQQGHARRTSMSSKMSSQPAHPTLLIPGPIEFDDAVLQSMSHYRSVYSPH